MDFNQETASAANTLLDLGWAKAPREVFAAMMALADPADVAAALCAREEGDGATEWRSLWLTDSLLIYCSAKATSSGWDYDSNPMNLDPTIEAWAMPLGLVESIGVSAIRTSVIVGGRWSADVVREVRLRGRLEPLAIPLFGGFAMTAQHGDQDAAVTALTAALAHAQP